MRNGIVDRVLGGLFVLACAIAFVANGYGAPCDQKCRNQSKFIKLGAKGSCFGFESKTCYYCTTSKGGCLKNIDPEPGTCTNTFVGNRYKILDTDCVAACDVGAGMDFSEATGTPIGAWMPASHDIRLCQVGTDGGDGAGGGGDEDPPEGP